jgi:hypothetical protein
MNLYLFSFLRYSLVLFRVNESFVTKSWPVTAPGSQGVFRGRGRGFGFLKKWAPGSYCLELVVACPAAGTSAQILLVEGK